MRVETVAGINPEKFISRSSLDVRQSASCKILDVNIHDPSVYFAHILLHSRYVIYSFSSHPVVYYLYRYYGNASSFNYKSFIFLYFNNSNVSQGFQIVVTFPPLRQIIPLVFFPVIVHHTNLITRGDTVAKGRVERENF